MVSNLYIAAVDSDSGKSLVLLGIMELLSKRIRRLGIFRPIIHRRNRPDPDIELIQTRYQLDFPYESLYALNHEQAQHLVADGHYDELLKVILEKYKALEQQCDFIVCEGADTIDVTSAFDFDLNVQVANDLGSALVIVANGQGKTPEEVVDGVRAEREAFLEEGCTIVATIVNRVPPEYFSTVTQQLNQHWLYEDPVFVLPEEEILWKPTIGEIAEKIQAKFIHGDGDQLNREVHDFKVAAMQVPHFLEHIDEGSLIVTPGDRADILLSCLVATLSENYPNIAGIILTGDIQIPLSIYKLIDGFSQWSVPIMMVKEDTFETATKISQVRARITADKPRKIATALGIFESYVDGSKIEERISVSRSHRRTPLMFEYELIERAKNNKKHIVLPEGNEERILQATEILLRRGVVDITLLGQEAEIRQQIAALGLNLDGVKIVDPNNSDWYEDYTQTYFELRKHKGISRDCAADVMHDNSYFATMMVYKGVADGMVSGAVHTTAHTIRPALEFIKTQPGCSIVSSVFLMSLEDRVLVYGDCAVNPNPNPQQLADIAITSAMTAKTFGIEPLVAMLSYSTGESGKGEDVDKVREATKIAQQLRPDLKIEGPIQYDAAVDESVAKTKLPGSEVAGHATVFIFPDLNTGNNTYKAVQRSANAVAIGPVLQGLKKPVNDLSRGCTITDIVNTVAITAIQAQSQGI
ncbi:phosphate acetyltransferase [Limnoraphis robusta]|uniref:Phosphate acetyltransferase n=1 Tax=Limnoraphis robusta CCNP1315 TaxID=3110306 RepID=A0ABU5TU97_9CYAN|nr:phosphate acetyltransferase [Limnoraphis robusta]MEA5518476.1 phosphate acetyltransferase [Limnoraphis robusta CCNP1315]MEA5545272.1 phosphate acetyltransferase [Limnoraphis robusta CCNP1324]